MSGCHHAHNGEAAKPAALPTVQVAPVTVGEVVHALRVTGTLAPLPNSEAKISPPFAGKLARLYVQPNQTVAKGQVVAQMTTETLLGQVQQAQATIAANKAQVQQAKINALQQRQATQIAIRQQEATLAGAQAALSNANRTLEREQRLFADGLVALKDVDDARAAVQAQEATVKSQQQAVAQARANSLVDAAKEQDIAIAQAQVRNAQGALTTARAQIALATLHAPLSGVVATVSANNGEVLDTSATIATIVDTTNLQLTVAVPSRNLRQVHRGQTVKFSVESLPHGTFSGVIDSIGSQVDATNGTIPVLVRIHNARHLLKDDMTATGQIVVERHVGALLIPKTTLLTDPDTRKTTVIVVGQDYIAHLRPVTVGLPSGDQVEIIQGLNAGEQVAVSGQYGLPDNTKVSIARGA